MTPSEIENKMNSYFAWIGLRQTSTGGSDWRWSGTSQYYHYTFVDGEPQSYDKYALAMYNSTKVAGELSDRRHFFFCHYWEDHDRKYTFYPNSLPWNDAFQMCDDNDQHLAVVSNWGDFPRNKKRDFPVWTGQYHDGESWKWSDGEHSNYWKSSPGFGSGSNPAAGLCGAVWSQSKNMSVHDCSEMLPYLCYANYSHNLVLVKENLTWEEALEECQNVNSSQPHQLLSVESSELLFANSKAIDAETDKVWLGLRFLGGSWFWSNGENVSLPDLPSCPESTLGCGALQLDRISNGSVPQPTVELTDCSERLNLLCYKV
ncbi:hypothetical protein WMY93_012172 [Mugilogobius chulae]|uniref:C-type lectin domain-containing protein n=1 Tax=Mugilogobius chulae TaxID=88201 RepID=A0AAW0PG12_9GOBI